VQIVQTKDASEFMIIVCRCTVLDMPKKTRQTGICRTVEPENVMSMNVVWMNVKFNDLAACTRVYRQLIASATQRRTNSSGIKLIEGQKNAILLNVKVNE
jgi:hypothetical protein